ncbi:MerR family transcriptional regulator [Branchiibius sp. NY16-3462-2]|uniref:transcriptional regulator FtsR n=1 Tax=Branchiibius sp. NY16-3462-2 TaxID=1807500 RepID=UPI0007992450|nr:MerR family transcriptional regulator [Branchiibius sp. NY16-3462-2]KYH44552.1 hypothetical protein AZH51_08600 [Branchiibius sp. NY16-3462-2]
MAIAERGRTVGAVLQVLQPEFPDLTISKLRYLDAEGLVSPTRSASGYRRYSAADVDRLRFVLTAQRDRFWPLKKISEALDAYERGLAPSQEVPLPVPPTPQPDPDVSGLELQVRRGARLTAGELRQGAGLDRAALADLEAFGLLRADKDGYFDEGDLSVAAAAATLMSHGVEGRHLRLFHLAAGREVDLVRQMAATTDVEAADLVRECLALHVALVRSRLSRP